MTPEQKELYKNIDKILWIDWDPIGINDVAPRDEYQGYTPQIFSLKLNGAETEVIALKLFEIETKTMGLLGNIENCRQVATKIAELNDRKG